MLFAEGEQGNELFVIREGVVRITKVDAAHEKEIAVLQSGDIMGEMSFIEGLPRSSSAIAIEDCDVLAIVQDDFPQLIKSDPAVAMRIGTALSEQICIAHSKIVNSGLARTPLLEPKI
jgi:CRP/FNR family transcriptional regulator